jgi:SAM-dependent methyltransferase
MLKGSDVPAVMTRVEAAMVRNARSRKPKQVVVVSDTTEDGLGIGALRQPGTIQTEFASGSARPVVGKAVRYGKRAVRRGLRWYVKPMMEQQSRFNQTTLDLAERLHVADERAAADLDATRRGQHQLEMAVDRLRADIERLAGQLQAADADPELLPSVQRQLRYREFEDRHRGTDADIKDLLRSYMRHFTGRRQVLDIGCGRGEFLELLRDADIGAYGVDLDEGMVAACAERGVPAVAADAIAHLRELAPGAVDGIFSSQVAEHLSVSQLMSLLDVSARRLAPGGVIVMETPNPESLFIFSAFFYVDITHVKPIHPEALKWAMENVGFVDVTIERVQPVPPGTRLEDLPEELAAQPGWRELAENFRRLNHLVYGPQHYAAIGYKPEDQ